MVTAVAGLRVWGGGVIRKHVDGGILFTKLIRMLERSCRCWQRKKVITQTMTMLMGVSNFSDDYDALFQWMVVVHCCGGCGLCAAALGESEH